MDRAISEMMHGPHYEVATASGASFCSINSFLLDSILRLSEKFKVKAATEIVDEHGAALLPAGAPVTDALRERTRGRRLRQPLEASLDIEDGVSMSKVISDCLSLVEQNPALWTLGAPKGWRDLLFGLRSIALSGPLRLLLTMTRETRPRDYEGGLAAMMVSAGLAHHAGFSPRDAEHLMLAALVADIGEAYINPELLEVNHTLSPNEWESVVWHPCIGAEFLKKFTQFPRTISDSVLRHHERFDGHGYPFRVRGERLGAIPTMLGVADTLAALVLRDKAGLTARVWAALHVLPGEFPPPILRLVSRALEGLEDASSDCLSGKIGESTVPALSRLRAAKDEAAELIHYERDLTVVNAAELVLNFLVRIDHGLETARMYDLLQRKEREQHAGITGMTGMLLDEIDWRMRSLARSVYLDTAQSGSVQAMAVINNLVSLLDSVAIATKHDAVCGHNSVP